MHSTLKMLSAVAVVMTAFACCLFAMGGSDCSEADTEYRFYLDNSVEGENSEINGWYDATGTSAVDALVNALDAAGIEHPGIAAGDGTVMFSSEKYISDWSTGGWASDGERFGVQWSVWNYNAEKGWYQGNTFGNDPDTIYYISHEMYLDIDGRSAADAGIANSEVWADPEEYGIVYDGTKGYDSVKQALISFMRDTQGMKIPANFGLLCVGSEYTGFEEAYGDWLKSYDKDGYKIPAGWTAPYPSAGYLYLAPQNRTADPDHLMFGPVTAEVGDFDTLKDLVLKGTPRALKITADMDMTEPVTLMHDITVAGSLNIRADVTVSAGTVFTVADGYRVLLDGGTFTNGGMVVNHGTFDVRRGNFGTVGSFDGEYSVLPFFDGNDTVAFVSGAGTVTHTAEADVAVYDESSEVTACYRIVTLPEEGTGDWDVCGTAVLDSVTFSGGSAVLYVPSYILGKVTVGSCTVYTYCKVTAVSDDAKNAISEHTASVYLPRALRDTEFGDTVTVIDSAQYTDAAGNTVRYRVDETAPAAYSGYMMYPAYACETGNPDVRFVEQGTVTHVDFAPGQTEYGVRTVNWTGEGIDLVSPEGIVCGSPSTDMIAAHVEHTAVRSITFDTDGGSQAAPVYVIVGDKIEVPDADPAKTGYTFVRWEPEMPCEMPDGDVNVKAVWTANRYTVSFDANGGELSGGPAAEAAYDGVFEFGQTASRAGYAFVEWNTSQEGTGTSFSSGDVWRTAGDTFLYARWAVAVGPDPSGKASADAGTGEHLFVFSDGTRSIEIGVGENMSIMVADASALCGKTVEVYAETVPNTAGVEGEAYSIVLRADGEDFGGKFRVTLPYSGNGTPAVFFWDGSETVGMTVVSHTEGSVTFETDHNSTYIVGTAPDGSGGSDSTVLIATAAGIAALSACLLLLFFVRRKSA